MPPTNGTMSVTNDTQYGAEVSFECDNGFRIEGNASSVCQLSGQWEPGSPTCQLIGKSCFWQQTSIGIWMQKETWLNQYMFRFYGERFCVDEFICNSIIAVSFCSILVLYKTQCFVRVPIDCGNLSPPEDGVLSLTAGMHGNSTLFATATYTCDLGFNLSGSAQRTCTNTSEWLPGAPNCTLSRNSSYL